MLSEHKGHTCQHRSDDFAPMAEIIRARRPVVVVELGTDRGGFAAWLADLVAEWGGEVTTFDIADRVLPGVLDIKNLRFVQCDVLAGPHPLVVELIGQSGVLLYCDNGNKQREIELYAPLLRAGSMLAVHDYNAEVKAAWAEPFVAALGYAPERHDLMESLRNEWYPEPMTRFWLRREVIVPPVHDEPVAKPIKKSKPARRKK